MVAGTALDRAQAGDPRAFAELVLPYASELRLHCYRMLGSLVEAEEVVQDVLQAAWTGLPSFERRATVRTWLYRIATNRSLNARRNRARRERLMAELPFVAPTPSRHGDPRDLQPFPDRLLPGGEDDPEHVAVAREHVELAFIAALQCLPGRQVAAVVLRDVVGYERAEVALLLDVSPTTVKGLLQRGRAGLARHREGADTAPAVDSVVEQAVVDRFSRALIDGDVEAVVAVLTSHAVLAMPPLSHEYVGREAIAAFLQASHAWTPDRTVEVTSFRANTQPSLFHVITDRRNATVVSGAVVVLTLAADRITRITRFLDPAVAESSLRETGLRGHIQRRGIVEGLSSWAEDSSVCPEES